MNLCHLIVTRWRNQGDLMQLFPGIHVSRMEMFFLILSLLADFAALSIDESTSPTVACFILYARSLPLSSRFLRHFRRDYTLSSVYIFMAISLSSDFFSLSTLFLTHYRSGNQAVWQYSSYSIFLFESRISFTQLPSCFSSLGYTSHHTHSIISFQHG